MFSVALNLEGAFSSLEREAAAWPRRKADAIIDICRAECSACRIEGHKERAGTLVSLVDCVPGFLVQ